MDIYMKLICMFLLLNQCDLALGISCKIVYVTDTSQYITSHSNYGSSNYRNNEESCWILIASNKEQIVGLKKHGFHLQSSTSCSKDVLKIYDSNTFSGRTASFCDRDVFTTLYSSNHSMFLWFETDGSKTEEGFEFEVKQYDMSKFNSTAWKSTDIKEGSLSTGAYIGIGVGCFIAFFVVMGSCSKKNKQQ